MSYFVIQVKTRGEEKFLQLAEKTLYTLETAHGGILLLPRRTLTTRRRGKTKNRLLPIYPGYIFYRSDNLDAEIFRAFRRVPGFCRYLGYGGKPEPLTGEDEKLLLHFLSFGEVVETSRVYFDTDDKIRVVSGPMSNLEGRIVKVDKRKRRAKVSLSLYENSFLVDFGFELLEQAVKK